MINGEVCVARMKIDLDSCKRNSGSIHITIYYMFPFNVLLQLFRTFFFVDVCSGKKWRQRKKRLNEKPKCFGSFFRFVSSTQTLRKTYIISILFTSKLSHNFFRFSWINITKQIICDNFTLKSWYGKFYVRHITFTQTKTLRHHFALIAFFRIHIWNPKKKKRERKKVTTRWTWAKREKNGIHQWNESSIQPKTSLQENNLMWKIDTQNLSFEL